MGKNNQGRPRHGGGTIAKTYSSGVNGMKEHIFDCGGHKDTARFNETQEKISNCIIWSSEKGGPDVTKTVHTLQLEDLMPVKPSEEEKNLAGLEKDVWMDKYWA